MTDRLEEIKKGAWTITQDQIVWMISEIERLRKETEELSADADKAEWKVVEKTKEIEQLRAALEEIASGTGSVLAGVRARGIAELALKEKE